MVATHDVERHDGSTSDSQNSGQVGCATSALQQSLQGERNGLLRRCSVTQRSPQIGDVRSLDGAPLRDGAFDHYDTQHGA